MKRFMLLVAATLLVNLLTACDQKENPFWPQPSRSATTTPISPSPTPTISRTPRIITKCSGTSYHAMNHSFMMVCINKRKGEAKLTMLIHGKTSPDVLREHPRSIKLEAWFEPANGKDTRLGCKLNDVYVTCKKTVRLPIGKYTLVMREVIGDKVSSIVRLPAYIR